MELSPTGVVLFARYVFDGCARIYGGDTTVNQLRILNELYQSHMAGREVSQRQIAESLGIPASSVSRTIIKLLEGGWIREYPHPADRRRRLYRLSQKTLRMNTEGPDSFDAAVAYAEKVGRNI